MYRSRLPPEWPVHPLDCLGTQPAGLKTATGKDCWFTDRVRWMLRNPPDLREEAAGAVLEQAGLLCAASVV